MPRTRTQRLRFAAHSFSPSPQVLLTLRLSWAESPVGYTLALVPLYVAMLPSAYTSVHTLILGAIRRVRPTPEEPPPTCKQLAAPLLALLSLVLTSATVALAGLNGDGYLSISWWLVLLPAWGQLLVLWTRWYLTLRSTLAARGTGEREEQERAAKLGMLSLGGLLGILLTVCCLT